MLLHYHIFYKILMLIDDLMLYGNNTWCITYYTSFHHFKQNSRQFLRIGSCENFDLSIVKIFDIITYMLPEYYAIETSLDVFEY